jgi:Ca2+-binding EF-hand superfamily protein
LVQLLNVSNSKLEKEQVNRKMVEAQVKLYLSYFNQWDKDANGKLDKEEFKLLIEKKVPKHHIDIVFQYFDFNHDHVINFDEFFKNLLEQKIKKDLKMKESKNSK